MFNRQIDVRNKGWSKTGIYGCWNRMLHRCYDKKNNRYYRYGARGIKVCKKWHTFTGFKNNMMDTWFEGATLDRIDNDKNYSKNNCKWATKEEQALNKSTSLYVEINGKKFNASVAERMLGLPKLTIAARKYCGIPESEWLKPIQKECKKRLELNGVLYTQRGLCRKFNLKYSTVWHSANRKNIDFLSEVVSIIKGTI